MCACVRVCARLILTEVAVVLGPLPAAAGVPAAPAAQPPNSPARQKRLSSCIKRRDRFPGALQSTHPASTRRHPPSTSRPHLAAHTQLHTPTRHTHAHAHLTQPSLPCAPRPPTCTCQATRVLQLKGGSNTPIRTSPAPSTPTLPIPLDLRPTHPTPPTPTPPSPPHQLPPHSPPTLPPSPHTCTVEGRQQP